MRTLRRIVFINSASIRYAEVHVDGNVHFIGTQGVGKSTLLRAILFFYNADKLRLGIPKEMKSFDEFYLPYANSYIAFEVDHEHGPFTVLVLRAAGRACYRFIDAPFDRKWLVDDRGEVTSDIKVIRARLGQVAMTKLVDRYEQYRDILYGRDPGKEFARFQLMSARNYQNIYRSIQNVFLNSRLDANFIKDIIIRSMSEEESSVNLGYYRTQVADFEHEYTDISCWFRKNAKGECTVRRQADGVVEAYRALLYLEDRIKGLAGELNFAVDAARTNLPHLEEKIVGLREEDERQRRLSEETEEKHKNEERHLYALLNEAESALKRAKERRDYYAKIEIDAVLSRFAREADLKAERTFLQNHLKDLTARYDDVVTKFDRLIDAVNARLEARRTAVEAERTAFRENQVLARTRAMETREAQKREAEELFLAQAETCEERLEALRSEKVECEKARVELKHFAPYAAEIARVEKEIGHLREQDELFSTRLAQEEAHRRELESNCAREIDLQKAESNRPLLAAQQKRAALEAELKEIDALLARVDDSFYAWLETNVPNWEATIGRVVDEKKVLFASGLNPRKSEGDATSLYGVALDVEGLASGARRPADLKVRREELDRQIGQVDQQIRVIGDECDHAVGLIRKRYQVQLAEIDKACAPLKLERAVIPKKQKQLAVEKQKLLQQTEAERTERETVLAARERENAHRMDEVRKERAAAQSAYGRHCDAIDRAFAEVERELAAALAAEEARLHDACTRAEAETATEIAALRARQTEELNGKGADTSAIETCRAKLDAVEREQAYLDANRKLVFNYQRDKEELFDREDELKATRKIQKEKIDQLDEKYRLRREEHARKRGRLQAELREVTDKRALLQDGLEKAQRFHDDLRLCSAELREAPPRETLASLQSVLDDLKGEIVDRQTRQNDFKKAINVFKANFSAKNTFNFKVNLNLDEDYLAFAANLSEFLANNLIEEYRRRTGERYAEILSRVSAEMGDLSRHVSDVDKIIGETNRDFKTKNFAGVVKLIELRTVTTADKMAQLMQKIKAFNDEHAYDLGELSLFSTVDREAANDQAVDLLLELMKALNDNPSRQALSLSDLFQLQFRVVENDNDTQWVDKLSHVGSEGTDTLVKAMVNIMLINVFKTKVTKKGGSFKIHCMMDEIGKLHPSNIKGILDFANARDILLVNSSPTSYNVSDYRYTYLLDKRGTKTVVYPLVAHK